jgi:hypothetical protein
MTIRTERHPNAELIERAAQLLADGEAVCWRLQGRNDQGEWVDQPLTFLIGLGGVFRIIPSHFHPSKKIWDQWEQIKTDTTKRPGIDVWIEYLPQDSIKSWGKTIMPIWGIESEYRIVHAPKPLALINWSQMPFGTMTNLGKLVAVKNGGAWCLPSCENEDPILADIRNVRLKASPSWFAWTKSHSPVPPGVLVGVSSIDGSYVTLPGTEVDWAQRVAITGICNYRITGALAEGYTDDPDKATK